LVGTLFQLPGPAVNILLLSMPDSFEHMPPIAVRMPNGALTSLAGNLDPEHQVAVADLILVQDRVRSTVLDLLAKVKPDVVGLSVMTFQRATALKIVELIRSVKPDVKIAVGGYDPSLAAETYMPHPGIDFIVRGEGDVTFRELVRGLQEVRSLHEIAGLSHRAGSEWRHNPDRAVHSLESDEVRLPRRDVRALAGYTFLGKQIDVIETSRGCTFDCSFCSIIEMRGRNFHTYSFDRVLADIRDARAHGARAIFIVDDNITLNVHRFEALCRAIVDAKLNDIEYLVQAMTSAIANHGETLAPLMRQAGFRYVFLGIENILEGDLTFLRASAKNTAREKGKNIGNATVRAIDYIHQNGMQVVGGLIVGSPDDTRESIEANLEFARHYVDWPYIQHPTPYPRTPMTKDFREQGLVTIENVNEYDGTTAVVRTKALASEEIEYMRWRAERWMKVRHIPSVIRRDPRFVMRNWLGMLRHTMRGATLKTWLRLEDEREAFRRYKAIRAAERVYL
jgi:anaerobic magnesium-protoporphyrin IX monomethyl ester cyclase